MRNTSKFIELGVVTILLAGCSLQKWDPINYGSAGDGGEDSGGSTGSNASGATFNNGGSSALGGTTSNAGGVTSQGTGGSGTALGGTSSSVDTTVGNGGTTSSAGGTSSNGGGTTSGGTTATGGTPAAGGVTGTGGTSSVTGPCGSPAMIDDMEDGNTTICPNGGRVGTWYVRDSSANDEAGLGVRYITRGDSRVCMQAVYSGGATGWATLGVSLGGTALSTRQPYDASAYVGIRFWARRGSGSYPTTVTAGIIQRDIAEASDGGTCDPSISSCSAHYGTTISVGSSWAQHSLLFANFSPPPWATAPRPLDKRQILGFEFFLEGYASFDLQIDDLSFL